jgi:hypothetical protein
VKVDGVVRSIAKFSSTFSGEEDKCKCPKCCDGYCYVIVFTDFGPVTRPIIMLGIVWMSC